MATPLSDLTVDGVAAVALIVIAGVILAPIIACGIRLIRWILKP